MNASSSIGRRSSRKSAAGTPGLRLLGHLLALSLLAGCFADDSSDLEASLRGWGLPEDLAAPRPALRSLSLTGPVDRIDWLPRSIENLSLSGSRVRRLRGLGARIRSLNLCNTSVADLSSVPADVRWLDLRFTEVRVVSDLPSGLELLAIGGENLEEIAAIPASLQHLEIDAAPNLESVPPFGGNLRSIALFGADETILERLPPGLEALSLVAASASEIDSLPQQLKLLVVTRNQSLRWINLPPQLEEIWIDHLDRSPFGPLPDTLRALTLQRSGIGAAKAWPFSLKTLRLYSVGMRWEAPPPLLENLTLYGSPMPPELPASLAFLELGNTSQADDQAFERLASELAEVSGSLTSLSLDRLPEGLDLSGFDALRHLELSVPDGPSLAKVSLPEGLEELAVHSVGAVLPSLPLGLRRLDLKDSQGIAAESLDQVGDLKHLESLSLANTGIDAAPELPASLEELDLSGTAISEVGELPSDLVRLTMHVGQLARLGKLPRGVREIRIVSADGQPPCPDLSRVHGLGARDSSRLRLRSDKSAFGTE